MELHSGSVAGTSFRKSVPLCRNDTELGLATVGPTGQQSRKVKLVKIQIISHHKFYVEVPTSTSQNLAPWLWRALLARLRSTLDQLLQPLYSEPLQSTPPSHDPSDFF